MRSLPPAEERDGIPVLQAFRFRPEVLELLVLGLGLGVYGSRV